jgi:hypothetical protein
MERLNPCNQEPDDSGCQLLFENSNPFCQIEPKESISSVLEYKNLTDQACPDPKIPEFSLEPIDTDQKNSDDEVPNSQSDESEAANTKPVPKTKKEPKWKVQERADFFPCLIVILRVFSEALFDTSRYAKLTGEQKQVVFYFLDEILKTEGVKKLRSFLSNNMINVVMLRATDFCTKKSRVDEMLKLVISQALKKIYHDFMRENKINQNLNPSSYTKRADINSRIYKHYFKRELANGEHMKLFCIKNGVTREWFECAIGGSENNPAFIDELLKVLRDPDFFHFYSRKVESMLRRMLGIADFSEDQELLSSEAEKASQIKSKLQGADDQNQASKTKMPCHKFLFQNCVEQTISKIEELAALCSLKLASKK